MLNAKLPQFATQYNRVVPDSFRVVVDGDVVTAVPGAWYKHVGTEVVIDGESNTGTIIIDPRYQQRLTPVVIDTNGFERSLTPAFAYPGLQPQFCGEEFEHATKATLERTFLGRVPVWAEGD